MRKHIIINAPKTIDSVLFIRIFCLASKSITQMCVLYDWYVSFARFFPLSVVCSERSRKFTVYSQKWTDSIHLFASIELCSPFFFLRRAMWTWYTKITVQQPGKIRRAGRYFSNLTLLQTYLSIIFASRSIYKLFWKLLENNINRCFLLFCCSHSISWIIFFFLE